MSRQTNADPGDVLVRVGGLVFGFGAVATIVTFVPLFFDFNRFPTFAYWLCMLMPAGFLVSLTGLLVSARAQRRRAAE
ncbi:MULTISPECIES: hypothetical protein [Kitasatospora]|uniref:ABC-type antimicrobial peptide transport system permease subunit n=2 Tax=Kitasatospora TaxID=2063 RepID=A0ABT1IPR4_9ACTN|nr:hypothetical protein [Kitasatospora paracochleata]MCP2307092.1 ABC-type antimicrobial peptide transport system permease subunit [Kitasatospora paracochleata]